MKATGCICGKHMLVAINEGTCLWCGRGTVRAVLEHAYRLSMIENHAPVPAARLIALPARPAAAWAEWDEDRCVAAYRRWQASTGRAPSSQSWQRPLVDGEPDRPSYSVIRRLFGGWAGFLHYIAEVPREQAA